MHSDKGLLLEKSVLESFYDGQFTLSPQLIEPNYIVHNTTHCHSTTAASLMKNLPK